MTAATDFVIYGSELSPYSVKLRAFMQFKQIPTRWVPRCDRTEDDYRRHARLPIVPTLVTPDGQAMQDSTPIMLALEADFPEPATVPPEPGLGFLAALIEEFGDEWGNKLMFHHRWFADVDSAAAAQTLAWLSLPDATPDKIAERASLIRQRMVTRGHFVGSSPDNAPLIRAYLLELLDLLEVHLGRWRYLMGGRPGLGDFGLAAQLYQAAIDPTCGAIMRARAPTVLNWCHRCVDDPRIEADFAAWPAVSAALRPLLAYIGRFFLPWTLANHAAIAAGKEQITVALPGGAYSQMPQKYHAKSLAALRQQLAPLADNAQLTALLAATNCLAPLTNDSRVAGQA